MVAHVALLLQPLQASVVGVQLEGLVEKGGPQRLERVHHGKELQQVRWIRALQLSQLARLESNRMKRARVVGLLQDGRHGQL